MPPALDPPTPAGRSVGSYRLVAHWASGGMADVYVARRRGGAGFDKVVALKALRAALVDDPELHEMFLAEARTAALLTHPNIVQTFDFGHEDGVIYIAMELIDGEPLGAFAQGLRAAEGTFPTLLATEITRKVALALHYAHTLTDDDDQPLGLVHRDVSPSNIMLTHNGIVKLLDFGIVKVSSKSAITQAGTIKGKFAYMSPEQASGKVVDARSDVFALGVVLWQLLTGKRAFDGNTDLDVLRAVLTQDLRPPSQAGADCGAELDAIVRRASARRLEDRYATAKELADALTAFRRSTAPDYDVNPAVESAMSKHFASRLHRLRDVLTADRPHGVDHSNVQVLPISAVQRISDAPSTKSAARALPSESGPRLVTAPPPPPPRPPAARTTQPPRRGRRELLLAALALAAVALAAVGVYALRLGGSPASRQLSISSDPPRAEVTVGGRRVGHTPLVSWISGDAPATLSLRRRGFEDYTKVLPARGALDPIHATLRRAAAYGTVSVRSHPSGARIQIDGRPIVESTPAIVTSLWIGEPHTVIVTAPGFEPRVTVVEFESASVRNLDVVLRASAQVAPESAATVVLAQNDTPATTAATGSPAAGPRPHRREGAGVGQSPPPAGTDGASGEHASSPVAAQNAADTRPPGPVVTDPSPVPPLPPPLPAPPPERAPRLPSPPVPVARVSAPPIPSRPAGPTPARLTATIGAPLIDGIIQSAGVQRAISGQRRAVQQCYERAYAQHPFEGRVTLTLVIGDAGGHPSRVSASAEGASAAGVACARDALASADFPDATATDAVVRVVVRFSAR